MKPAAEWTSKCTWCLHSGKDSHPDLKGTPLCYLRKYPGRPRDHPKGHTKSRICQPRTTKHPTVQHNFYSTRYESTQVSMAMANAQVTLHKSSLKGSNTVALRMSKYYFNTYHHLPRVINVLPQNNLFLYTNDEASFHSTVENSSIL